MIKDRAEAIKYLTGINKQNIIDSFKYILNFFRVRKEIDGYVKNSPFNNLLILKKNNVIYYTVICTYSQQLIFVIKDIAIQELIIGQRIERFQEQFITEYKNGEFRLTLDSLALTKKILSFLYEDS